MLPSELTSLYTKNDVKSWLKYLTLENILTILMCNWICVTQEHAVYMTEKFNLAGLESRILN